MAESLSIVSALTSEGRFEDALQNLAGDVSRWVAATDVPIKLVALELLERTGRLSDANALLLSLRARSRLSASDQARASIVEGLLAKHYGHIAEAQYQFRQACRYAEQSGSLALLSWASLRLFGVAAEGAAKDGVAVLRSELRRNVEKAGAPNASVAFHVFTAEYEAKHGQLSVSRHHGELAESLLARHPNVWLRGLLDLQKSCLSYLEGDFAVALEFAKDALESSGKSGHVHTKLVALADMAAAYLAVGQPGRANSCIEHAMAGANADEQLYGLLLETLAEAQLENRDVVGCEASLARAASIAASLRQSRPSWHKTWNLRTRSRLLQRRGRWDDSLALLRADAQPPGQGDSFTKSQIQVLETLALGRTGAFPAAARSLLALFSRPMGTSPLLQGLAQSAVASVLAYTQSPNQSLSQYSRALRILAATGEASGLIESVDQYVDIVGQRHNCAGSGVAADKGVTIWRPTQVQCHLEKSTPLFGASGGGLVELAAFMGCIPDLVVEPTALGEEALRTMSILAWIEHGRVERISPTGCRAPLVSNIGIGSVPECDDGCCTHCDDFMIPLGSRNGDSYELRVVPKQTFEATLGCGATSRLIRGLVGSRESVHKRRVWERRTQDDEVIGGKPGVFRSSAMKSLVAAAKRIASQDITVLLTGESGTGKEIIANLIHETAGSAGRPFVVFNCATVPTDMVESQLFGYRRGAFTGAVDSFRGVIRAAEGGTLFLDEIGELPLATQPKLLRFLDSFEIQPLGEALPQPVRVRVLAATNADLEQRVEEGRFRADLFYRLNVVHFRLPPLRERREEIRPLAESFLARCCEELGKADVAFAEETVEHLLLHHWPGNVRQLFHEVRRIVAFVEPGTTVRPRDLDPRYLSSGQLRPVQVLPVDNAIHLRIDRPLAETIRQVECAALTSALSASNWRNDDAAKRLGLSRKGLYLKRRRLGIDAPER